MKLVELRTYFDRFQANAHLALLENSGIEAILENEDETVITGTHVKIRVLEEDLERAKAIIEAVVEEDE
jgi:type III secretory pathway lipoprotein EscJ